MLKVPGYDRLTVPITFPIPLTKSRDYNAINLLFVTIFNYFYVLAKESKNIHNPKRCNANLLPLLAQFYRYEYTDVKDVAFEREIIGTVPNLHHWKGTETGVNNALALSKVDKTDGVTIPWFYDPENNIVVVIVFDGMETYKMLELLALVIPLGTKIALRPGHSIKASEEVKFHSWVEINFHTIDPKTAWYITPNNYWKVEWDPEKELYHTYVDYSAHIGTDGLDPNVPDGTAGTRIGNTEIAGNETTPPGGQGETE